MKACLTLKRINRIKSSYINSKNILTDIYEDFFIMDCEKLQIPVLGCNGDDSRDMLCENVEYGGCFF